MTGTGQPAPLAPQYVRGVWLAYQSDWSGVIPFRDELNALRYAMDHSMFVVFCPFGKDPQGVVREKQQRQAARDEEGT